jgi:hypothetical protein
MTATPLVRAKPWKWWVFAVALAVYLYCLLPATATFFYELHHLTGVDGIYWGYTVFKIGGYYLSVWEYREIACVGVAVMVIALRALVGALRKS